VNQETRVIVSWFIHRLNRVSVTLPAILCIACATDGGLVPASNQPYVYILLSSEPIAGPASEPTLVGFLLTQGSPVESSFRHATRFDLKGPSSLKPFRWFERGLGVAKTKIGFRGVPVDSGNYYLPEDSSTETLGRKQLRQLGTYSLLIETDGVTVSGSTTIPGKPSPQLLTIDGRLVLSWPKVPGAAAYFVEADTEAAPGFVTTDTLYTLFFSREPSTVPADPQFRIVALDPNASRFFLDVETSSAGIDNGYGLYGSATPASVSLPRSVSAQR
jgi:hypothetical protein